MKNVYSIAVLLTGVLCLCAPSRAWWPHGHGILSEAAVRALPPETPHFFRDESKTVGHYSLDPDVAKNRATPRASSAEAPEHFIDWELIEPVLGSKTFPKTRYTFLKLCYDNDLRPNDVGLLPFSMAEWTERLTIDFAQHRRWPQNKAIQNKCLMTAGILAHYAEDLCQPLHVTIHHDGRANADGSSPKTGIHNQVDALIEVLALSPLELSRGQKIESVGELLPAIILEIHNSRAHVETVYALEAVLPKNAKKPAAVDAGVLRFTDERAREATRFTAALFLTAWRRSENVELPTWLQRAKN